MKLVINWKNIKYIHSFKLVPTPIRSLPWFYTWWRRTESGVPQKSAVFVVPQWHREAFLSKSKPLQYLNKYLGKCLDLHWDFKEPPSSFGKGRKSAFFTEMLEQKNMDSAQIERKIMFVFCKIFSWNQRVTYESSSNPLYFTNVFVYFDLDYSLWQKQQFFSYSWLDHPLDPQRIQHFINKLPNLMGPWSCQRLQNVKWQLKNEAFRPSSPTDILGHLWQFRVCWGALLPSPKIVKLWQFYFWHWPCWC